MMTWVSWSVHDSIDKATASLLDKKQSIVWGGKPWWAPHGYEYRITGPDHNKLWWVQVQTKENDEQ
tara:strand:+ start:309 stop:506 length:198 start_codon:yes stop_codon:yes gene_type:complete